MDTRVWRLKRYSHERALQWDDLVGIILGEVFTTLYDCCGLERAVYDLGMPGVGEHEGLERVPLDLDIHGSKWVYSAFDSLISYKNARNHEISIMASISL